MTPAEQRDRYQEILARLMRALGNLELGNLKTVEEDVLTEFNSVEVLRNALVKEHPDAWKDPAWERLERLTKEKGTGQRLV